MGLCVFKRLFAGLIFRGGGGGGRGQPCPLDAFTLKVGRATLKRKAPQEVGWGD